MGFRIVISLMGLLVAAGCASNTQGTDWNNLDYTRIAREYEARQYDRMYSQPTVAGCVDDDLYNCR